MNNKRFLFISCSQMQLMYALQIKNTLLRDKVADIVVMTTECDIEPLYSFFDKIYVCNNNSQPPNALVSFWFPKYALSKYYVQINPLIYTDVFFWGPTWIYYFLYKFSIMNEKSYIWHLYPEGIGNLMFSTPEIPPKKYGKGYIKNYIVKNDRDKYQYGEGCIKKIADIYMIGSQYAVVNYPFPIVEIPLFDFKDVFFVKVLNKVFDFSVEHLYKKIIFIDGCIEGSRKALYDINAVDNLLIKIGQRVGKDNIYVKRHHRAGMELYSDSVKKNVTIIRQNIPWELLCMNGGLESCLIIGRSSSALINPLILFDGLSVKSFILDEIMGIKLNEIEIVKELFKKVSLSCSNLHYITDESELFDEIDKFMES